MWVCDPGCVCSRTWLGRVPRSALLPVCMFFQYRVTLTFFPVFYTISCFVVVVAAAIVVLTVFRLDAKILAVVMPLPPTCHL